LRDRQKEDSGFIEREMDHICASYQHVVTNYLLVRLEAAALHTGVKHLALAGGVSANSALREKFIQRCNKQGWQGFIPSFEYCTDNAAMIGIAGYYQWLSGTKGALGDVPKASWPL
jgi:N6-L-threonylcarbamoyladenine synthase